MDLGKYSNLAILRATVGYLGEKSQYAWWQSSFFTPISASFLIPVFPRTQCLAQCHGVTVAASRVHDEHIGIGRVYHLFRLPEDVEQVIHRALHEQSLCDQIAECTATVETAFTFLRQNSGALSSESIGPTHVGDEQDLRREGSWKRVAAYYLMGFENKSQIYPYFRDMT